MHISILYFYILVMTHFNEHTLEMAVMELFAML